MILVALIIKLINVTASLFDGGYLEITRHRESLPDRDQSQDLLTVRHQCKPLHQRAAVAGKTLGHILTERVQRMMKSSGNKLRSTREHH